MTAHEPLPVIPIASASASLSANAVAGVAAVGSGGNPDADPAPRRPPEPDPADCCGEGCIRCVYDRYDERMERYQLALAAWQERHPQAGPDQR